MSHATLDSTELELQRHEIDKAAKRHSLFLIGGFLLVAAYFVASFIQFDIAKVIDRWKPDRAAIFVLDSYAHKDHVTMNWKEPEKVEVRFEGGFRFQYDPPPAWYVEAAGQRYVQFDSGAQVFMYNDRVELKGWPDTDETFVIRRDAENIPYVVGYENSADALPPTFRVTATKVEIRSEDLFERIQVFKTKVEVHRYEVGWKYFWFDFDSPLAGVGIIEAIGLMFDGERVDPSQSNASLALHEFLDNSLWLHGAVLFSLVETVFMALLGTMIACMVGLPLAFLAAKNIQPLSGVRFILRRLFDMLRGIDVLIWSIIFLRAFGPGLFTGIFAIAFTDTGTLGKLMSEAIENSDNKQQEGVRSTGATKVQQHRFGILPQIMPIFISQSLYYLESNTRGAVIIGAMGAGGIGLKFLGALQTGTDWENVMYMAFLVLLTVIFMDWMSARLRRALIGIER